MKLKNLTPSPIGTRVTLRSPPRPEITLVARGCFVLEPGKPLTLPEGPPLVAQGPNAIGGHRDGAAGEGVLVPSHSESATWQPRRETMRDVPSKFRPRASWRMLFRVTSAVAGIALVNGGMACTRQPNSWLVGLLGPSSGSLHFEGSDPLGTFSGDVDAYDCQARFRGDSVDVTLGGDTRRWISVDGRVSGLGGERGDEQIVSVTAPGASWNLLPSSCSTFDVREWFDAEKHLHVFVRVDCTTDERVHIKGIVSSDSCHVRRPG